MEIRPESRSGQDIYKILIGTVLPRPIAWVSSVDVSGNINLAPFSFFTVASVNPPILCFAPLLQENSIEKDTLVNIKQTGDFVHCELRSGPGNESDKWTISVRG